jgi:hypothetical protein
MKRILIDAFVLEVTRAVDRDLCRRIGANYSSNPDRQRLVAILLALKDTGSLSCYDLGGDTCFLFGRDDDDEVVAAKPDKVEPVLDEDKVAEYWEKMISVKMKRLEMSASIELSKRCRADIDLGVVESSEAAIQPIYAASIIEGRLRLICPEVEDGLILQDLTRSTAEEGCFVWFSLGDKANGKPFMEDLEQPHFFEGQPFRIPIKADASQSKYGKAFVTAML